MSYRSYFSPYVSVAEKRAKAEKKIKNIKKKNSDICPVIIEGRTIANTWWGKSWNKNLESYADYTNRIGRGRSYVLNNAVLDLKIKSGTIESLVMGTRSAPYKVKVKIKKIKPKIWEGIKKSCQGEIDSLQELFAGKFPKSLSEIFTDREFGFFPSPEEIFFDCSCPDWADMCKHIAATLYGVGARLDSRPEMFFTLRGVKMEDLVTEAVKDHASSLLKKTRQKSSRVIDGSNLSEIFGIDLEEKPAIKIKKEKSKKKIIKKLAIKIKKSSIKKAKKPKLKKKISIKKKVSRKIRNV